MISSEAEYSRRSMLTVLPSLRPAFMGIRRRFKKNFSSIRQNSSISRKCAKKVAKRYSVAPAELVIPAARGRCCRTPVVTAILLRQADENRALSRMNATARAMPGAAASRSFAVSPSSSFAAIQAASHTPGIAAGRT